jgi:AcrR family transcriptional regulator
VPAQITSPPELVAAARTVLEREGLEGLTLRAVAREAGVSHGAPLRHFPGLATLLAALAAEGFVQLYEFVDAGVRDAGADAGGRARLAGGGRGYVRFAVAHPGVFSLMFRGELIDSTYAALAEHGSRAFNQLVDLVVYAQAEGFAPAEEPRHAAVVVWALVHGVATLWIHGGVAAVDGDLDLERIGRISDALLLQSDSRLLEGTT